jgi:hypothetical protein
METIEEIREEVAKQLGELHFDVLLETEISLGDFKTEKYLLDLVSERYINQYIKLYNDENNR